MAVGENIRKARLEKGMTQKQVADACGMADSAIRKYESGQVTPKYNTLQRIAHALGYSVGYLLGSVTERVIMPGRLKIVEVDDPESGFFRYDIEATDDEALNYGYQILGRAGISVQTYSPQALILAAMEKLNNDGQQKAVERVEELTEMPRYQAQEPPTEPSGAPGGTDTTPAETPPEGQIQAITMICPICGMTLRGDPVAGKAHCDYCKRSFPLPQILK